MTDNISDVVKDSILAVKSKIVPTHISKTPLSADGNVLQLHTLYDFFGLDFSARNARETLEQQRKLGVISEYLEEQYGDINTGLGALEQELGQKPADIPMIEHFYHHIKYKNQALEMRPKEEKVSNYKSKITEAQKQMEALRREIKDSADQLKQAKELGRITERLQKLETRKKANEERLRGILSNEEFKQYTDGEPKTSAPTGDGRGVRGTEARTPENAN